ncbi:MAG TPA: acetyltransferase [Edaphocola sp.]|nr:acetyltransferase [Edaphocola sp.]
MLIVGAKGFAKEILEICKQNDELEHLVFYDDVNLEVCGKLFDTFPILKSLEEAKNYFETIDPRFSIGIGIPPLRKILYEKFIDLGGQYTSTISPKADLGSFGVNIGEGANILDGAKISNAVTIGKGSIVYYNAVVTHDCHLGDFVELSPSVNVSGRVKIGNMTRLGTGTIVLPDRIIGNNVIIGAGAVVTQNIPDNCTAVGVPARIIKRKE